MKILIYTLLNFLFNLFYALIGLGGKQEKIVIFYYLIRVKRNRGN